MHLRQRLYHFSKAAVKASFGIPAVTPSQAALMVLLIRVVPARASFTLGNKKSAGAKSGKPILNNGSSVDRCIVPIEKEALLHHLRPFQSHFLHEDSEDLHNVGSIDTLALPDEMAVDEPGGIKEGHDHEFGPAGMDTHLYRTWLPLRNPSFRLFLGLRRVEAHQGLVHGHYVAQPGLGEVVDIGDEIAAHLHPLQFQVLRQKFGHPSG